MRKLRQLSNKSSSTATVQAKGTKRKSQVSKGTCGRKSTKSTSKASPSSKETTDISIDIVPREVDNPLLLPQIPHAVLSNGKQAQSNTSTSNYGSNNTGFSATNSSTAGRSQFSQAVSEAVVEEANPNGQILERDTQFETLKLLDSEVVDGLGYFSTLKAEASGFREFSVNGSKVAWTITLTAMAPQFDVAKNAMTTMNVNIVQWHKTNRCCLTRVYLSIYLSLHCHLCRHITRSSDSDRMLAGLLRSQRVIAKQAEPAHNHLERPDTNTITIHNNSFPRLASSSSSTLWFR
ncbi:hypothetical protein QYF36_022157 [Acer negundo]|nr:hypothetical protein QYF36_022157 [Acer negundo]